MYAPSLRLSSFDALPEWARIEIILRTLEALTVTNIAYLTSYPVPPLYRSGVRYLERVPCVDGECWQDAALTYKTQAGNCKELSSWRVAELIIAGEDARHRVTRTSVTREHDGIVVTYHVTVRRGNGTIEDPSRLLGMP